MSVRCSVSTHLSVLKGTPSKIICQWCVHIVYKTLAMTFNVSVWKVEDTHGSILSTAFLSTSIVEGLLSLVDWRNIYHMANFGWHWKRKDRCPRFSSHMSHLGEVWSMGISLWRKDLVDSFPCMALHHIVLVLCGMSAFQKVLPFTCKQCWGLPFCSEGQCFESAAFGTAFYIFLAMAIAHWLTKLS